LRRLLSLSLLVASAAATLDLRSLSSLYTAPTCSFRQSCLFMMDDFRFEMCGCPNETECTGKFNAIHQGTRYSFCSDPLLDECSSGDLSVTIQGLQTTLHCACLKPLVERKVSYFIEANLALIIMIPPITQTVSPKMTKLMNFWKHRSVKYQERGAMNRLRRKQKQQSVRCQSKDDLC
ncbi:hypothetical protein PENTCL1PPCAC_28028, partial [Pristionchus entomophagus]